MGRSSYGSVHSHLQRFYWFRKTSWKHWQEGSLKGKTFLQYLTQQKISGSFIDDFLLNYLSRMYPRYFIVLTRLVVHTCTYDTLRQYPAELIVKFLHDMTSGYGLWRFSYGTKDVAERLLACLHFYEWLLTLIETIQVMHRNPDCKPGSCA